MNTILTSNKSKLVLGVCAVATTLLLFAGVSMADAATREFTDKQRTAIQEAKQLKAAGDIAGARKVLEDANVFRATHIEHRVPTEEQRAKFTAIKVAVETNNYAAFQAAAGPHLTSKIDTQADFEQLVAANGLRKAGDRKGALEIMKSLGFKHSIPGHAKTN